MLNKIQMDNLTQLAHEIAPRVTDHSRFATTKAELVAALHNLGVTLLGMDNEQFATMAAHRLGEIDPELVAHHLRVDNIDSRLTLHQAMVHRLVDCLAITMNPGFSQRVLSTNTDRIVLF